MPPDQLSRLIDILQSARLIQSYTAALTCEIFETDSQTQDAVIRRIEIIGEAAKHLSSETQNLLPELPFRAMRGMRNIVAHDYGNASAELIWKVAREHIPSVIAVLERFLATQNKS